MQQRRAVLYPRFVFYAVREIVIIASVRFAQRRRRRSRNIARVHRTTHRYYIVFGTEISDAREPLGNRDVIIITRAVIPQCRTRGPGTTRFKSSFVREKSSPNTHLNTPALT